ncbi:hypothetical protein ACROYT_G034808 [Oculina patagonica]
MLDVAIPEDGRVREKEDEEVEKYQYLAREVLKMWGVRTKVIPVVVGALRSIPLRLNDNLGAIEVGIPFELIQRCVLLGSARILKGRCRKCRGEEKADKGRFLASLGNLLPIQKPESNYSKNPRIREMVTTIVLRQDPHSADGGL